mgnify:CR=1 FL=1
MQQVINVKEVENAMNKYGDIVLSKNSNNNVIVMSVEQYKSKLKEEEIEKKLLKAEKQIEDGKTINATEVFKELEEKYGF